MLIHFLSIVGVLGIVIVGMLVMTQLVSLEDLGNGIGRAFIVVLVVFVAFCVVKTVLLPILGVVPCRVETDALVDRNCRTGTRYRTACSTNRHFETCAAAACTRP